MLFLHQLIWWYNFSSFARWCDRLIDFQILNQSYVPYNPTYSWCIIKFFINYLNDYLDKGHIVKAMVFPVVMFGCESWTIKKAKCWRIDTFELRCWRRLLRIPWTVRRSNQSILKEISPEYSLEGLMLKLKLQYFGHLMRRANSLEKILMLGKIEGRRRRGWEDERVGWHEFEQALGNGEGLACFSLCDRRVGHDCQLNNI